MSEERPNMEAENERLLIKITEELLREKLYEFRGRKVMLDSDLAEIYGYETKNFNRQVRNNLQKFEGDDFMFVLSDREVEELSRCKKFTLNKKVGRGSNIKHRPSVFTEQGIYMLMTVLRGDLAIRQSRALIRTFKKMKDYILESRMLIEERENMGMLIRADKNAFEIGELRKDLGSVERQISDIMTQLDGVVSKSELADMMNGFVGDSDNGWLIYNARYCDADVVYSSIYSQAKQSIYIVDNYIGLRTLVLLKNAIKGIDVKIFSDNIGSNKLHRVELADFCRDYPDIRLSMWRTMGKYHDRFIVLDFETENERVFLCGASSKDAGARITSIVEDYGTKKYHSLLKELLGNDELRLP